MHLNLNVRILITYNSNDTYSTWNISNIFDQVDRYLKKRFIDQPINLKLNM